MGKGGRTFQLFQYLAQLPVFRTHDANLVNRAGFQQNLDDAHIDGLGGYLRAGKNIALVPGCRRDGAGQIPQQILIGFLSDEFFIASGQNLGRNFRTGIHIDGPDRDGESLGIAGVYRLVGCDSGSNRLVAGWHANRPLSLVAHAFERIPGLLSKNG